MIELDPGYCDVILQRWQEATGNAVILEGDGASFAEVAATRLAILEPQP